MVEKSTENAFKVAYYVMDLFYKNEEDKRFIEMIRKRLRNVTKSRTVLNREELDFISGKLLLIVRNVIIHSPFIEEVKKYLYEKYGIKNVTYTLQGDIVSDKEVENEIILDVAKRLTRKEVIEKILFSTVSKIPPEYINYGINSSNLDIIFVLSRVSDEEIEPYLKKYSENQMGG